MIGITPEEVLRNIASVKTLTNFNDQIRSHVLEEPDLSEAAAHQNASSYIGARAHVANLLEWKVYSHCASITRLYALYEVFVYKLVAAWLTEVPTIFGPYATLPNALLANHRAGIGQLLQKYGRRTQEKWSERSLVESLYFGLRGDSIYSLLPDAFYVDLGNLRESELCAVFGRAGLGGLQGWLSNHSKLAEFCETNDASVGEKLKELVDLRNEAAHGGDDVNYLLGVGKFHQLADFVGLICEAIHEFVLSRYCEELGKTDRLELVGQVTEYFRRPNAAIVTMRVVSLSVDDIVIAKSARRCLLTKVVSIQVNGASVDGVHAQGQQELGTQLFPIVEKGAKLFREKIGVHPANTMQPIVDESQEDETRSASPDLSSPSAVDNSMPLDSTISTPSIAPELNRAASPKTSLLRLLARVLRAILKKIER